MRDHLGYRRLFAISSICLAAATLAMATVSALVPLLIILAIGGLGWMIAMSTFNLVVQTSAAGTHRGRAISVYYISLFGGLALGSSAFGHIAELLSVAHGIAGGIRGACRQPAALSREVLGAASLQRTGGPSAGGVALCSGLTRASIEAKISPPGNPPPPGAVLPSCS